MCVRWPRGPNIRPMNSTQRVSPVCWWRMRTRSQLSSRSRSRRRSEAKRSSRALAILGVVAGPEDAARHFLVVGGRQAEDRKAVRRDLDRIALQVGVEEGEAEELHGQAPARYAGDATAEWGQFEQTYVGEAGCLALRQWGKTGRPRMVLLRTGSWAAEEGRGGPCRLDGSIRDMPPRNLRPHAHRPSERGGRLRPEKGLGYGNTARALATGALMTGAPAPFVEARLGPTHSQRCIFVYRERRLGPP